MSNDLKTNAPPSPVAGFQKVLERMKPQMALAIPRHMSVDRMARLAMTAFSTNKDLQNCRTDSILGSLMTATQLGLEPGINGQGYLIAYKGNCTFVPGWKGLVDLVARAGRAIGADLRYFKGGLSASSQLDYDLMIKKVNIASIQGNWQVNDMTSFNVLLDRRTTPILTLGNILFFQTTATAKRVSDLLGTQTVEQLRETVNVNTAYQNQFRIGATRVLNANWQTGADFGVSNVDEIKPNQENLTGSPASGNLWSTSVQLIGSNLYSLRDTHVFNVSFLGSPNDHGVLMSYNNLTSLGEKWQLEPSVKYYTSSSNQSGTRDTWTLGMRGTFRVRNQVSLESEVTYELTDAVGTTTSNSNSNSSSTNYYLGARVDF